MKEKILEVIYRVSMLVVFCLANENYRIYKNQYSIWLITFLVSSYLYFKVSRNNIKSMIIGCIIDIIIIIVGSLIGGFIIGKVDLTGIGEILLALYASILFYLIDKVEKAYKKEIDNKVEDMVGKKIVNFSILIAISSYVLGTIVILEYNNMPWYVIVLACIIPVLIFNKYLLPMICSYQNKLMTELRR